jgi:hypothetical protein
MKQIKTYARLTRILSIALMIIMSCTLVLTWFSDKIPFMDCIIKTDPAIHNLPLLNRLLGFLVDGLWTGLLLIGLYYCIELMKRFETGEIFSQTTTTLFQKITKFMFWWAVYTPIQRTLHILAVTLSNPPGYRQLIVGISSIDIFLILIFLLFHVISSIMQEAVAIKSEQDLII